MDQGYTKEMISCLAISLCALRSTVIYLAGCDPQFLAEAFLGKEIFND